MTIRHGNSIGDGGGIQNSGTLTLTNSTVSGNTATFDGGGTATSTNSTISGNTATGAGGGIKDVTGDITLVNTVVAKNTAGAGPDCEGTVASLGHNLIGDDSGCTFTSTTGDLVGTGASPKDAKLSPLGDFGGLTKTHALFPGSPALDAGNPDAPGGGGATCETTDQRGVTRPKNGRCDIGAFEFDAAADEIPSLTVWGLVAMTGLLATAYVWRSRRRSHRQHA